MHPLKSMGFRHPSTFEDLGLSSFAPPCRATGPFLPLLEALWGTTGKEKRGVHDPCISHFALFLSKWGNSNHHHSISNWREGEELWDWVAPYLSNIPCLVPELPTLHIFDVSLYCRKLFTSEMKNHESWVPGRERFTPKDGIPHDFTFLE